MDCTSHNSAKLQPVDNSNKLVDIDVNDDCRGGFVNNVDDDDVGRVSKATTSGSSSSNPKELGKDIHDDRSQPSSPTTMMMMIAKGKRTKRQRLRSRININNASSQEEEDEEQLDMANCLILLAQGHSRPSSSPSKQSGTKKLSSHNKRCYVAGVYECNTCNRIFSSFQALGGHRASHKKLKITAVDAKHFPAINSTTPLATVLSLQLGNINYSRAPPTTAAVVVQNHNSDVKSRNRIHECSICGAEFSSGQALGGHMRRHRGTIIPLNSSTNNNLITNTTLSLSTAVIAVGSSAKVNRMNTSNDDFLSLDLNLPASPSPEDHDHTKFSFAPKQPQPQQEQQQSAMAFSPPALVDCFY